MPHQQAPKGLQRYLRDAAIIVAATCLLLAAAEVITRTFLVSLPPTDTQLAVISGRAAAVEDIRLKTPAGFVTDKNGLWVANSATLGVNRQGYRSPEFDEPAEGRKTILMLGDSFTYGNSAVPLRSAYPDLVRAAGYKVCNCGIPGTATAQYDAQAKLLAPEVHPDIIAVMFYTGNDFEVEPPIVPGRPRNYDTNIGVLGAYDEHGQPLSLTQAAERYVAIYSPGVAGHIRRMVYSSGLWTLMSTLAGSAPAVAPSNELVLQNLHEIRATAESVGARFELFLIPTRSEYATAISDIDAAKAVLSDFNPRVPGDVTQEWYADMPDPHFNNTGHARMAAFILQTLVDDGLQPQAETLPATR